MHVEYMCHLPDRFFFRHQNLPFWVEDFCIDCWEGLEEVDRYEMRVEVHGQSLRVVGSGRMHGVEGRY